MISLLNHVATIATVAESVSSSEFRWEIFISRRKADMKPTAYRGGGHLRHSYFIVSNFIKLVLPVQPFV